MKLQWVTGSIVGTGYEAHCHIVDDTQTDEMGQPLLIVELDKQWDTMPVNPYADVVAMAEELGYEIDET